MEMQSELWVILQDDEYNSVWEKFNSEFQFNPYSAVNNLPTFSFHVPNDSYDISNSLIYKDDESINTIIRSAFIDCMGNDGFMYALDWHHTCFRYNPRIADHFEYPVFVKYDVPIRNENVDWEGYDVWFPTFYPDGDFYFFIANDFNWGYLTHPWLKKVWVFGDELICLMKQHSHKIGFIPCTV